jgi:hypothetical protein
MDKATHHASPWQLQCTCLKCNPGKTLPGQPTQRQWAPLNGNIDASEQLPTYTRHN